MNEELKTGLKVRSLLDDSASRLPDHIQARLDRAISASVSAHRQVVLDNPLSGRKSVVGGSLGDWFSVFTRPAISLALSAFFVAVAGFGIFQEHQSTKQAEILAMSELDAAILTDDLPPDVWLDPGFVGYSSALEKRATEGDSTFEMWPELVSPEQPST